jgi:hypothetical protein
VSVLGKEIARQHTLELELAGELADAADRHAAEPDVFHLCRTLAQQARRHADRLAPLAERHGARLDEPNGRPTKSREDAGELLQDLMRLWVLAQECWIEAAALKQAALAMQDGELLEAVSACLDETAAQAKWLKTRIKTSAPQALTVE